MLDSSENGLRLDASLIPGRLLSDEQGRALVGIFCLLY